jgi:hypothetical protein
MAVQASNANNISSWGTATLLDDSVNSNIYGVIVPLISGDIYSIWMDGTTIEGKVYDSSAIQWQDSTGGTTYPDGIATGASGLDKNLSAVADSSGNIHLTYINSSGNTMYQKYTLPSRGFTAPLFASSFDGADTNLCNGGDGWTDGICDSGNTAVGNETTTIYSPTYGANFSLGGTSDTAIIRKTLGNSYSTVYGRIHFNLSAENLGSSEGMFILVFADTTASQACSVQIYQTSGGNLILAARDMNYSWNTSGTTYIQTNTWYTLEYKVYRHPTAGTMDVWLNGTNVISATNQDTGDNDKNRLTIGINGGPTTVNTLYVDNVVVDTNPIYAYPWSTATVLDSNSGNTYTTISLDTSTGDLYSFWIRSNNIYYKKYTSSSSTWGVSPILWKSGTNLTNLTSNYSGNGMIFAQWTSGSGSPYTVNWDILLIPEKIWLFMGLGIVVPWWLKRRKRKA